MVQIHSTYGQYSDYYYYEGGLCSVKHNQTGTNVWLQDSPTVDHRVKTSSSTLPPRGHQTHYETHPHKPNSEVKHMNEQNV